MITERQEYIPNYSNVWELEAREKEKQYRTSTKSSCQQSESNMKLHGVAQNMLQNVVNIFYTFFRNTYGISRIYFWQDESYNKECRNECLGLYSFFILRSRGSFLRTSVAYLPSRSTVTKRYFDILEPLALPSFDLLPLPAAEGAAETDGAAVVGDNEGTDEG